MVSTLDFESSDPSSNLGGTLYSFIAFLLLLPEGVRWNKVTMLRQLNSQQRAAKSSKRSKHYSTRQSIL